MASEAKPSPLQPSRLIRKNGDHGAAGLLRFARNDGAAVDCSGQAAWLSGARPSWRAKRSHPRFNQAALSGKTAITARLGCFASLAMTARPSTAADRPLG